MNTPARALAWEIWRKNRYGFWLLFGLWLACSALSHVAVHFATEATKLAATFASDTPEVLEAMARAAGFREMANSWGIFLFGGSLLVTFGAFAFSESHATRGISGIPSRLFAFPVRTTHLVGLPTLTGIVFVAVLYLAWSRLVLAPLLPLGEAMPDGYLLLLLAAALVAFQLLVWTLPHFPKTRLTLMTVLITVVIYLSTLPFADLARWPERKAALEGLFAGMVLLGPIAAWLGVSRLRRGDWCEWPALTLLMTRLANVLSRRREFATPASALFWIEFRRSGLPAMGVLAVVICLVLGFASVLAFRSEPGSRDDLFDLTASPILMFLVTIWIPVIGLMLSSDGTSRRLRMTMFQAVRPVSTSEFLAARLKTLLALWLGGWLFSAISIAVWAVICGRTDDLVHRFTSDWDLTALVSMVLISSHLLFGLFPLWLTGRVPGLPWSFFGLLIVYAGLANIISWFDRHSDFWPVALLLIGFAGAVKLGIAAIAFRRALKQKLMTRGFVFGVTAAWITGTALLVSLASELAAHARWDEEIVLPFAALLFPIARIALAPLALAMNRHR